MATGRDHEVKKDQKQDRHGSQKDAIASADAAVHPAQDDISQRCRSRSEFTIGCHLHVACIEAKGHVFGISQSLVARESHAYGICGFRALTE